MEIKIKGWDEKNISQDIVITEHKNNNFVNIRLVGGEDYTVTIDDFLSALIAFESKRSRKLAFTEQDQ